MNFPENANLSTPHCPAEDVLLDYAAGRLDPARAALFDRHAEQCAHCAALRAAQTAIWLGLDEWQAMPVSSGFNRELWRRIDAEAQPSWWAQAMRFSLWKRVAPWAVAMAVVVTAVVLNHSAIRPGKPLTSTTASVVVTVSDADQLERALDDIQLLDEVDAASVQAKPNSRLM